MQQYPDIDRRLVEKHIKLGYTQDEIGAILRALRLNASTANLEPDDPEWVPWINRALAAISRRFQNALHNGQNDALLYAGHISQEIRAIHFTNLLPTKQLLVRTESVYASKEYQRVYPLGYTDVEIRSLIRAGFTVSQIRTVADRMHDAKINGVDSQGLTFEQLDDLLFKKRSMNSVQTFGVVQALLSGIHSKMREGEVARCIIDFVTMFDVPYGLGGAHGQIDVGTRYAIIEAKVDHVTGSKDTYRQIKSDMNNDVMNPPNANGARKSVILYAPGYGKAATASIVDRPPKGLGAYVVRSCKQVHEQIRQLGGL